MHILSFKKVCASISSKSSQKYLLLRRMPFQIDCLGTMNNDIDIGDMNVADRGRLFEVGSLTHNDLTPFLSLYMSLSV
jgi:hypothetical protein